jgi:long-subunit acyl-CoA synthetase (AMP-forming)
MIEGHPECALRPQLVAVGGAKLPSDLLQRAEALDLPVFEGYGLSEAGSVVALNCPGGHRSGSVGRVLPHFHLRVGTDGEIWLRGQSPLRRKGDARCVDAHGWWPTGDLGRVDPDGFLHLTGRKRNCFITAYGRNVSPEWIEAELHGLPGVMQAVVDGEGMPINLAVVSGSRDAFVAAAGESALAALNRRLPDYARVAGLVWSDQPWSTTNGLATGNGRARREAVLSRHAAQLAGCRLRLLETTEQGVQP